jgi:hypothetical protein
MREAETIARRLDDPSLNSDIACGRAQDAVDAGDLATAHAQEDIGRANLRRLRTIPADFMAECAMATAYIAQSEGEYPRAIAVTEESMQALEQAGLKRTPRYTSIAHEHARSLMLAGDNRSAWAAEQAVMSIVRAVGRADTAPYFAMLNVGTTALLNGGQPRKAIELLQANEGVVKSTAPDAELPFYLQGTRLLAASAAGAALAADKALMEEARTAEQQGYSAGVILYRLGAIRAALDRGDAAAAEEYWSYVAATETQRADAAARRLAAKVLIVHAALDLARRDASAASQHVGQAIALIPEERRTAEPDWRRLLLVRAQTEYAQAQYPAAARDAEAAVTRARHEAIDPQSSAWIGEALVWRSQAELAQGKRDAAQASAKEAIPHLEQNLDPSHPLTAIARKLAAGSII